MNYSSTQGLASLGRNGDSMLVHMNPSEVAGLQGLAMSQGGSLTINPHTGLPEAFNLGGFFKSLLPTIVGGAFSMIPGMQFASYPMLTGILAGAATGALTNKNKLLGAVTGGLGGYSGANIMGAGKAAAGAMGSAEAAKTAATNAGIGGGSSGLTTGGGFIPGATSGADLAYNNAMMAAQSGGAANSAISGASGAMDVDKLLAAGKPIGMANTVASTASLPPDPTFLGNVGNAFKGIGGAATGNQAAIDAYTKGIGAESALGALGKTALPFGGAAVMGGLEESDIYGKPMQRAEAEKYDPYARLNLGTDTGLRLVAKGGYIDGYATGGSIQSGGIRDLYGTPDNQPTISPGLSGFGLGRLNNLAGEQAMTQAQTLGYAEGGVASLELPDPSKTAPAPENLENMIMNETAKTEMLENQLNNMTSNALNTGTIPTQNYAPGALSNIAAGMQNQSLPPQASFIQNLTSARTGYDEGGSVEGSTKGITTAEGIASIDPSRVRGDMVDDMARLPYTYDRIITPGALDFYTIPPVEYNPETYARALRKPEGMAEGGDVSNYRQDQAALNLDRLPSLNVNTGTQGFGGSGLSEPHQKMISAFRMAGESPNINPGARIFSRMLGGAFSGDPEMLGAFQGKGVPSSVLEGIDYDDYYARNPSQYLPGVTQSAPAISINPSSSSKSAQDSAFVNRRAKGGYLDGAGDGMSDSIPATIEGKQPARLADGEFVIPADVVSHLGNGSTKAGSKRLYAMLDKVRHARTGNKKQGKKINPAKYMPA
jgi:hypothetical protein